MIHQLSRYDSQGLQEELDGHRKRCRTCQLASNDHRACLRGRQLHELVVAEANRNRRIGTAPWYERVDLADLPSEKSFKEWMEEASQARTEKATTLEGIDVSMWNGQFPWGEAVNAGIQLGIAKASEGNGYTDPQWGWNVGSLLAPGPIVPGSYHFLRPDLGNNPVDEANWYLSRHPAQCFSANQPWVFSLDAESSGGSAAGCYAFLDTVSAKIGYSCWFYSYANWILTRGVQAFNRPLWLAWPDSNGTMPNLGWPVVTMQQYGTRGFSVGQVDADRFLGDMPTLMTLAGVGASPSPALPAGSPTAGGNMIGFSFRPGGQSGTPASPTGTRWDIGFAYKRADGTFGVKHAWADDNDNPYGHMPSEDLGGQIDPRFGVQCSWSPDGGRLHFIVVGKDGGTFLLVESWPSMTPGTWQTIGSTSGPWAPAIS